MGNSGTVLQRTEWLNLSPQGPLVEGVSIAWHVPRCKGGENTVVCLVREPEVSRRGPEVEMD